MRLFFGCEKFFRCHNIAFCVSNNFVVCHAVPHLACNFDNPRKTILCQTAWRCTKSYLVSTRKKLMLHKKVSHFDKNKLVLHKKIILCSKSFFFPQKRRSIKITSFRFLCLSLVIEYCSCEWW